MNRKIILMNKLLIISLLFAFESFGQESIVFEEYNELKTFKKDTHSVLLTKYLNESGIPCRKEFLKDYGLLPQNKEVKLIPYFSFSVSKKYVNGDSEKPSLSTDAKLLNIDFYIEKIISYNSENKSETIWDGRVYSENNQLFVGGYSSKYNEQPVAVIRNTGEFSPLLNDGRANEFPILDIPQENIAFDPFKWTLLNMAPSEGKKIKRTEKDFLPLDIYGNNGLVVNKIKYDIVEDDKSSKVKLIAYIGSEEIEIANVDLKNYTLVKSKEAFRPELIEGCTQSGEADVIKLTFEGKFTKNILLKNEMLYLKESIEEKANVVEDVITLDGDFKDWRNIDGVSDYEADYVSYLYKNPDSDLLEFKITNDDKYLYLYSRVSGAHGRTGENGRYYWYAYIDVDADPTTGYSPTRDDNCYFGVAIGDDSEAQFEFIDNKFVKTFFGFTGIGAEEEVLKGELELGPSYYSSKDQNGNKRDKYKIEYVNREGSRFITHDNTEGTSEDIMIALSPAGSEVEMRVELDGFLQGKNGKKLVEKGSTIDIAIGAECSSNHYGSDTWGADSTPVLYGYKIK